MYNIQVHKYGLLDFTRPKMIRQSAALSLLKTNPCVPIRPGRGMLEVEEYTTLHCHVFRGALHADIPPVSLPSHDHDCMHDLLHLEHHCTMSLPPSKRRV